MHVYFPNKKTKALIFRIYIYIRSYMEQENVHNTRNTLIRHIQNVNAFYETYVFYTKT